MLWHREEALLGSALLIELADTDPTLAARLAGRPGGLVFIAAPQPLRLDRPELRFTVDKPSAVEQKRLWAQALGPVAARLDGALDGVAMQFHLSAERLRRCHETLAIGGVERSSDTHARIGGVLQGKARLAVSIKLRHGPGECFVSARRVVSAEQ